MKPEFPVHIFEMMILLKWFTFISARYTITYTEPICNWVS